MISFIKKGKILKRKLKRSKKNQRLRKRREERPRSSNSNKMKNRNNKMGVRKKGNKKAIRMLKAISAKSA